MFCRPLKGWEGMSSYSRQFSLKNFKKHMKGMHEEHLFPFYVWSMKVEDVSPFMRFPRLHRVHCTYNVHCTATLASPYVFQYKLSQIFLGVTLLLNFCKKHTWNAFTAEEVSPFMRFPQLPLIQPPCWPHPITIIHLCQI